MNPDLTQMLKDLQAIARGDKPYSGSTPFEKSFLELEKAISQVYNDCNKPVTDPSLIPKWDELLTTVSLYLNAENQLNNDKLQKMLKSMLENLEAIKKYCKEHKQILEAVTQFETTVNNNILNNTNTVSKLSPLC